VLPCLHRHSPSSSSRRRGMVHGDYSSATFFTTPSRLPTAILPLHCTWAPLAGYRNSPQVWPWSPVAPCFVSGVFQKLFSSVSSVCCNGYIRMLQVYVSSVSVVFRRMFHVFHLYVFILMLRKDLMLYMLQWLHTYVSKCMFHMFRLF
jgi:hypothetical protein